MITLTANEQTSLDILNANNSDDIHAIQISITDRFVKKELSKLLLDVFREAITEKLKSFGYKSCGGTGR